MRYVHEKCYFWNLSTCAFEINRYLKSIPDSSVIKYAEILEPTKTIYI